MELGALQGLAKGAEKHYWVTVTVDILPLERHRMGRGGCGGDIHPGHRGEQITV